MEVRPLKAEREAPTGSSGRDNPRHAFSVELAQTSRKNSALYGGTTEKQNDEFSLSFGEEQRLARSRNDQNIEQSASTTTTSSISITHPQDHDP